MSILRCVFVGHCLLGLSAAESLTKCKEMYMARDKRHRDSYENAEEVPQNLKAFFSHPLTIDSEPNVDHQKSALALLHEYQHLPALDKSSSDNERQDDTAKSIVFDLVILYKRHYLIIYYWLIIDHYKY